MDALRSVTGRLTKIVLLISLSLQRWVQCPANGEKGVRPLLKTIESRQNRQVLLPGSELYGSSSKRLGFALQSKASRRPFRVKRSYSARCLISDLPATAAFADGTNCVRFVPILLQKSLRLAANRDSIVLTRILVGASHDGTAEERTSAAFLPVSAR